MVSVLIFEILEIPMVDVEVHCMSVFGFLGIFLQNGNIFMVVSHPFQRLDFLDPLETCFS